MMPPRKNNNLKWVDTNGCKIGNERKTIKWFEEVKTFVETIVKIVC